MDDLESRMEEHTRSLWHEQSMNRAGTRNVVRFVRENLTSSLNAHIVDTATQLGDLENLTGAALDGESRKVDGVEARNAAALANSSQVLHDIIQDVNQTLSATIHREAAHASMSRATIFKNISTSLRRIDDDMENTTAEVSRVAESLEYQSEILSAKANMSSLDHSNDRIHELEDRLAIEEAKSDRHSFLQVQSLCTSKYKTGQCISLRRARPLSSRASPFTKARSIKL